MKLLGDITDFFSDLLDGEDEQLCCVNAVLDQATTVEVKEEEVKETPPLDKWEQAIDICAELVKEFEGFEAVPYFCPASKLTIGYGNLVKENRIYTRTSGKEILDFAKNLSAYKYMVDTKLRDSTPLREVLNTIKVSNEKLKLKFGNIFAENDARELMEEHIRNDLKALTTAPAKVGSAKLLEKLDIYQVGAILCFCYNFNPKVFTGSTLFKVMSKNPKDPAIKTEFMRWVKAGGVKLNGLVRRREREAKTYFTAIS